MFAARNSSPVNHGFNTEEVAAYQVGGDTVTLLMSVTIKVFLVNAMSKEEEEFCLKLKRLSHLGGTEQVFLVWKVN